MARLDLEYLNKLVTRFKGFNSPSDAQKLIVMLGEKANRSLDENKKLEILLRAEKKAEELLKARTATRDLMNTIKAEERKLENRKKIIWGAALRTAAKKDPQMAQVMVRLFNEGYISDRDKDVVMADLPLNNNTANQF